MLDWSINKLLDRLEPRLEKLVRAAVDDAVASVADELDEHVAAISQEIIKTLKRLPVIGPMIP